jgi:hypothetical protein
MVTGQVAGTQHVKLPVVVRGPGSSDRCTRPVEQELPMIITVANSVRAVALAVVVSGCAGMAVFQPAPRASTVVVAEKSPGRGPLGIPPGHLPRAGECRLWYPGRPPGQQPRAGSCSSIERAAPAGSWVLYRPSSDSKVVHNRVIDSRRAGVVMEVRVYDADRGTYLRMQGK